MFKKQKLYLIVCLAITSTALLSVNIMNAFVSYKLISLFPEILHSLYIPVFLITVITLLLYGIKRTIVRYRISLTVLIMFFIINVFGVTEVAAYKVYTHKVSQIEKIDSCEAAATEFESDQKKGSLKYFTFGLMEDEAFNEELKDQYDLEVYHMGCVVNPALVCYNSRVEDHIKSTYNIQISEE